MIKLRSERGRLCLTQAQLAERSKLNPTTISKIEKGAKPWPGQAKRIADAIGWDKPIDELFDEFETCI